MWYTLFQSIVRFFAKLYHRLEVTGLEHIPKEGPFLLVGNHISYLDPFYIAGFLPRRVSFMAKEESFSHPLTKWFLRKVDAFPVNRDIADVQAIRTALKRLQQGEVVGIFPEGGRRDADSIQQLKEGAAYLAVRQNVPILPAYIEGSDQALPRGGRWIRPAKVCIRFGEPIGVLSQGKPRERQELLTQAILDAFRQLADSKGAGKVSVEINQQTPYNGAKE
ncbi:lysophospholipid acyltransferase family protein [Melghirimyces algeriensis]|uniref:1-acyl-sn-glycerol-3-phosphate acyltransferase n=1 Tax=Melghirimyces algeriensis TaxID=910412 RepID=A0A521DCK2_9BACL|nr:lysophospholipid acyltransferase family protein [Melghirimyces algeriensis]SMO68650.1 1-acyl-sn-glycerol-3-phosphate acyltransferase [Melghirimyces algeriensis]